MVLGLGLVVCRKLDLDYMIFGVLERFCMVFEGFLDFPNLFERSVPLTRTSSAIASGASPPSTDIIPAHRWPLRAQLPGHKSDPNRTPAPANDE